MRSARTASRHRSRQAALQVLYAAELGPGTDDPAAAAQRAFDQHWRLERMAAVDRNVLRLGAFELLHGDAPPEVVLDEAVELARRFGGEQSPRFVNGILDAMARRIRASGRAAGEGGTSP
jgi:transcription termination factor NusB